MPLPIECMPFGKKCLVSSFDWGTWFIQVNKHVTKSSIVAKLEDRVKEIGRSLAVRFDQEEASFHFLVHKSLHYCLQVCNNNAHICDIY